MRKLLCLVAFACLGLFSFAQNSSVIKDNNAQVRNVKGFHAINVSNGIDLYLSQGNEAVAVSASNTDYRDRIKTVVEDGVLKIYIDNDGHFNLGWHNPKLKAYVSVANLDELKASGGSDVYLQGSMKANKLDVNLSGGSNLKGGLEAADLSINQSGGSDVNVSGKVTNLTIDASGGSDFKGYDLATDFCHISASGGSDTYVTVNKELSANASGGSDIYYRGQGVIKDLKSSGSSSVSKK